MTVKEIAFYSPLKPADHPTPSGDRLMARQLIHCLGEAGCSVEIASRLRVFIKEPDNQAAFAELEHQAELEMQRLRDHWKRNQIPALWFCYHPYYKSPDLIGPSLCKEFGIPYMTAEASYSQRRATGIWETTQERVLQSITGAAVNICFTGRDKAGLREYVPEAQLATLRPFINIDAFCAEPHPPAVPELVTVAMMRSGDKMKSYEMLASALSQILDLPWTLSIVGDGPKRDEVYQLFSDFPADRLNWHGQLSRDEIAALFARSSLFVWPGCGEAYGLAYLEAQAAALPVVAFDTAGVPEVVDSGYSGYLTPVGDVTAYAAVVAKLVMNTQERLDLSAKARLHVHNKHSLAMASRVLEGLLNETIA